MAETMLSYMTNEELDAEIIRRLRSASSGKKKASTYRVAAPADPRRAPSFRAAVTFVERFMAMELRLTDAEFQGLQSKPLFGEKYTEHMKNLGYVIGRQVFDEKNRLIASWRADFDPNPVKDIHINFEIYYPNERGREADIYAVGVNLPEFQAAMIAAQESPERPILKFDRVREIWEKLGRDAGVISLEEVPSPVLIKMHQELVADPTAAVASPDIWVSPAAIDRRLARSRNRKRALVYAREGDELLPAKVARRSPRLAQKRSVELDSALDEEDSPHSKTQRVSPHQSTPHDKSKASPMDATPSTRVASRLVGLSMLSPAARAPQGQAASDDTTPATPKMNLMGSFDDAFSPRR